MSKKGLIGYAHQLLSCKKVCIMMSIFVSLLDASFVKVCELNIVVPESEGAVTIRVFKRRIAVSIVQSLLSRRQGRVTIWVPLMKNTLLILLSTVNKKCVRCSVCKRRDYGLNLMRNLCSCVDLDFPWMFTQSGIMVRSRTWKTRGELLNN